VGVRGVLRKFLVTSCRYYSADVLTNEKLRLLLLQNNALLKKTESVFLMPKELNWSAESEREKDI
jgi:hypothetical protein